MSILKTIIPLFLVLGLLQAAVLALPYIYWRFQYYLNPIERYLFGTFLLFTAFVVHPLIVITLITFTIAPTLLSVRHDITARLSTVYTALIPSTLPAALSGIPLFNKGKPQSGRDWLVTVLGSYVGWKTLGVLPCLMVLLVFLALSGGREEADGQTAWITSGGARGEGGEKRETGVAARSERTDVQAVGRG